MKRVSLICFGKLKTPGFELAVHEFEKRLDRYTQFEVFELKAIKVDEKSDSNRGLVQEKEAEIILSMLSDPKLKKSLGNHPEVWSLDETGKARTTSQWSQSLKALTESGSGELVIIIGSSLGLSDRILKLSKQTVSLGPQTLSHELARLVLTEQLYRSLSYLEGHPYHNEG